MTIPILIIFKLFLENDGYKGEFLTGPVYALYAFRKNIFDLVLLELKMQNMSGMLLYQKLRNTDPNLLFCLLLQIKNTSNTH